MKKLQNLLSVFVLFCLFSSVSAQEQVSFNYEDLGTNYPILTMFEHDNEARLLSVEDNAEILITTFPADGTPRDTLLLLIETEQEWPYSTKYDGGDYVVQLFSDRIFFVNVKTLEVNVKTLNVPKRYRYSLFQDLYLLLADDSDDPTRRAIRVTDMADYEVPRNFLQQLDSEWFYNYNYSGTEQLILYNVVSENQDTIVQQEGSIRLKVADDKLYVETDTELFSYDWNSGVRNLLYDLDSAAVKNFDLYKEELVIYEYMDSTLTMTVMDLDGQNEQANELTGFSEEGSNYFEILRKAGNDYLFKDSKSDFYRTEDMSSLTEVVLSAATANAFPEASDSLLYYATGSILNFYDFETNTSSFVDTVHTFGNSTIWFSHFLKIGNQHYLRQGDKFFTDYEPTVGMEQIEVRKQRPFGFGYRVDFMKTDSVLYIHDRKDFYRLEGEEFEKVENVEIWQEEPVEFKDAIYFLGFVNGVKGFYRIYGNEAPQLIDGSARYFEKSDNGDFLLLKQLSADATAFRIVSDSQDSVVVLDVFPDGNFRMEDLSIASTIYLEGNIGNDTTSLWGLNLSANTFEHVLDCKWFGKGYALHHKFVLPIGDVDGILKLAFIDRITNEVEYFVPPIPNGTEYHLKIYHLNCNPGVLLFELDRDDFTSFEIWSTEGTIASTQLLLEREIAEEQNFGDFSMHEHKGSLFFSVKIEENMYEHYSYDCDSKTLEPDTYPEDIVLCRRFNAGSSIFGISLKDPVNGHSLLDITDPNNTTYTSPLGEYRNSVELGYGFTLRTSLPMAHGEDDRHLAVLSILPFGQELCYVYSDGTIEMLTDLNPGLADAFLANNLFYEPVYKEVKEVAHGDHLYFDAYTRDEGHQVYRLPKGNLYTNNNEITNTPIAINLYPNPTTDRINIKLEEPMNYSWSIINLDGKIINKGISNSEEESFNVSGLTAGFYYFYMEIRGRRLAKGFVKE